jgi:hypothetical protein
MSIYIDSKTPYFLHQVDRWPNTGNYGDGKYIFVNNNHYVINLFNLKLRTITIDKNITIFLSSFEPDYNLFYNTIGKQWDNIYKQMWKDDENYTDYSPFYYQTFEDMINDKSITYNL